MEKGKRIEKKGERGLRKVGRDGDEMERGLRRKVKED